MSSERLIKKYPNRRLYDTAVSSYVTLEDIRRLVRTGENFRVVDARSEEDITRSILLQVILEQEERGEPIFTREILEQVIRTYGDALQGFMTSYLEQSMAVFLRQQQAIQEQLANLMETAPVSVFGDLTQRNLELWQSLQRSLLKRYGLANPAEKDPDAGG